MAAPKRKNMKGQIKSKNSDDPEKNPLLKIENKENFQIWTDNLLENPSAMIFEGYENFDLSAESKHFDLERVNTTSSLIIVLRYYEYICVARCTFSYIMPILDSDMTVKEVFDMIKHGLKTRLLMNVPSFETVLEIEIQYSGKILY